MSRLEKLPSELRNMIYFHVLVSPTGYIEPISRNHAYYLRLPGSISHTGPFWYLNVTEPSSHLPLDENFVRRRRQLSNGEKDAPEYSSSISTSLLRTNKNIYQETFSIFWENNTFLFSQVGMKQFRHGAGHMPFGNIRSMNIVIHHSLAGLDNLLAPLIKFKKTSNSNLDESKVFKCELRKLELSLTNLMLQRMIEWKEGYNNQRVGHYRGSIELLEDVKNKCEEVEIEPGLLVLFGDIGSEEMKLYGAMMYDLHEVFRENGRYLSSIEGILEGRGSDDMRRIGKGG
ncbi:uncharacterized protein PAC_13786 [Phialocephala subalpina]|uniref:F-box domain-containing protein n=1 Tax=Phialocephala subalpina TaxID=576137 RepID=A0A1L7XFS0_9HELO|nr:uncharacterized protein PAC_13786 [Phialocephala subalpina]